MFSWKDVCDWLTCTAFVFQVSAWGGYVFIINLIPLHVFVLLLMQRYSKRVYIGEIHARTQASAITPANGLLCLHPTHSWNWSYTDLIAPIWMKTHEESNNKWLLPVICLPKFLPEISSNVAPCPQSSPLTLQTPISTCTHPHTTSQVLAATCYPILSSYLNTTAQSAGEEDWLRARGSSGALFFARWENPIPQPPHQNTSNVTSAACSPAVRINDAVWSIIYTWLQVVIAVAANRRL